VRLSPEYQIKRNQNVFPVEKGYAAAEGEKPKLAMAEVNKRR